jgi:phosphatidyl-myo-inositol alpha-mannosyltransferase
VKVGLLCENYFPMPGGEQEHIFHLRHHLEHPSDGSEPVEVRILVPDIAAAAWCGPRDDEHVFRPARSVRIHAAGSVSQATLSPRAFGALRRVFAREQFDLLHIHAPCDIGLPGWALFAFDGPIVGTLHSYFPHSPIRTLVSPWYRHVMGRMSHVIAVSETARDTMARYARFPCSVISNGVDCPAFESGRPLPAYSDGMTNILSVGRLEHRNGVDVIIDAFGVLARGRPDVRLLLAGDGPLRQRYEAQARALPASVSSRIEFLGAVWEGREDLYASAHCFALGARRASFSILLLEALAAGLKVAALPGAGTDRAGAHWSLAEMARSESAADYADALRRALVPSTPAEVGRARAMAREFDWAVIVPRIRAVYDRVLAM